MKYVIVVEGGKFKVMYDDGTQLHQSREYGKDCVFEGVRAAEACRRRLADLALNTRKGPNSSTERYLK